MPVSCIIPAYNEAPRIGGVLAAVTKARLVDEVIVINDGSSDNTAEVCATFPKVICHTQTPNQGKTVALRTGVKLAKHEILMFLDADLNGLQADDIDSLIRPVLNDKEVVTFSLRGNSLRLFRLLGIDFITGERVFYRHYYPEKQPRNMSRFGYEVLMNEYLIKKHAKIVSIYLPKVTITYKVHKIGWLKGIWGEIKMARDIFHQKGLLTVLWQSWQLRQQVVKA